MSETKNMAATEPAATRHAAAAQPQGTGRSGMVVFASAMLIMLGAFHAIIGLVAVFDPTYFLVTRNGLVVSLDYTVWGWTHIGIGVVALLAGLGALAGQMWARVVGIILAVMSAVVNAGFIAAYPVWSAIVIAIDVIVVYALAVQSGEVTERR
jgi:hypothetical protein